MKISRLKPYERNARINDEAVQYVANSIREFGFKIPIVLDKGNVIIAGHTRLKAAKKLGLKEVPCIIADDLTDEQVRAFRLADNKVSEVATWDSELLAAELKDLMPKFDMSEFSFELPAFGFSEMQDEPSGAKPFSVDGSAEDEEEDTGGYYGDARERTADIYLLHEFDEFNCDGKFQMPRLDAVQHLPTRLIGFNYMLNTDDFEAGVHFYVDDYQFERVWVNPHRYMERMAMFDCMLTPDFSLYMNMPMAMKVWNVYRSRLIGQIMQRYGLTVIPTLSWAEPETFEFCFDGLEPGGVVSVSTIGVKRDENALKVWRAGMDAAMERLRPSGVVVYGGDIGYDFGNARTVYIANEVTERWKATAVGDNTMEDSNG